MENKLTITPEQFGLEKKQASTIEEAFKPKIKEREILANQYGEIIKKDINDETCQEATILRRQLVKVRTGIADIHKKQKSFYLAAGKFVDAWKNKETLPVTQMEEGLSNIETHFEKIEEQKREVIRQERALELEKYETVYGAGDIAVMDDSVYSHFLNGVKADFEAKKAEEKRVEQERIEAEKKNDLFYSRREALIEFSQFNIQNELTKDTTLEEYIIIVEKGEKLKTAFDKEQKRIKAENEQLKKEAELKRIADEKAENERQRLVKIEIDRLAKEQLERLKIESERLAKAVAERKQREAKAEKERLAHEAELKKEREEKERIQKELEAKAEAERKLKIAEVDRLKSESDAKRKAELAPDKERLTKWITDMTIQDIVNDRMSKESVLIAGEVIDKFNAFKNWATEKVKEIK